MGGILRRTMPRRLGARLVAGALATLVLFGLPPANIAAGASVVPPEPGAIILPGPATLHAAAGDLDGDGTRELLRLVGGPQSDGRVEAEAWRLGEDGWAMAGEPIVVRRGTSVEEAFTERATARTGSAPVNVGEPARILAWSDGARERLLIAALGDQPFGIPCCLTLWEPILRDGALALVERNEPNGPGETLHALDLDGDGDDELLMTQSHPADETPGFVAPLEVEALGWDGTLFRTIERQTFDEGGGSPIWLIGDTDGRSGDDAGFIQPGQGPSVIYRLRLEDGHLLLETASVPPLISLIGVPGAAEDDIVYAAGGASFRAHWGADGDLEVLGSSGTSGLLLPPIESSDGWRLPVVEFEPLWLILLDESLEPERAIAPTAAARRGADLGVGGAWIGALPGGDDVGDPAVVFAGNLLAPTGPQEIASMIGAQPIGLLGDGSWAGVLHSLGAPYDLERRGGLLRQAAVPSDPWISIVAVDTLMTPEVDEGRLVPSLEGAVATDAGDPEAIATTPDGFVATITAPPGTRVVPIALDPPLPENAGGGIVPESGIFALPVRPPSTGSAELRYSPGVLVLTPAGHAYTIRWNVRVLSGEPALAAVADRVPLSFEVGFTGRTAPGAEVTVDGAPIEVRPDGSFSGSVTAPPWPRTVRLEAVDEVGNRAVRLVSVVGIFDYRTLPWLPIIALLTLAAGALLYLRVPRSRPEAAGYDRVDTGALEEIETEPEPERPER